MRTIGAVALATLAACGHGTQSFPPDDAPEASTDDAGASGDGNPNLVGSGDAGPPCVNLQCKRVDCADQGLPDTTISGIVLDPAAQTPLYNVIVYIPNAPVLPFKDGVVCDQCGVLASGEPMATALTGPDGKFKITNAPVGDDIPLVLQLGKWRKQIVVPQVQACTDTILNDPSVMHLPRNASEGDMPRIAIATGGCDPFECLLRKIGIDASEFTDDGGSGHVQLFQGSGGAGISSSTKAATSLWSSANLARFDMIINACECGEVVAEKPQSSIDNLVSYADAGGRIFATHYQYFWIDPTKTATPSGETNSAWQTTAAFIPEASGSPTIPGFVDRTFPKGDAFAQWLVYAGAAQAAGTFPLSQARYNAVSVNPPSTRWVYNTNTGQTQTTQPALLHYTFNTPVGLPDDKQCGKVLFSDFHVVASTNNATQFPSECDKTPMTPQEKALEFMLFDLSACIQKESEPPKPPPPK